MKQKSFHDRMKKEDERLRKKEKTITLAKKMYARFGNKVLTYMINYSLTENGMATLFKLLHLPLSETCKEEDQHLAVVEWLNKNGERSFLETHRMEKFDSDFDYDIAPVITEDAKKPLYAPIETTKKEEGLPKPAQEKPPVMPQKPIASPIVTPAIPLTASSFPKQPATFPQDKKGNTGERRSGKERRHKPDRRADVELIFKNKRFGGERRSGEDRRKNWKPTE
ncbi:hypothetical protein JW926_13360 [Candidatus Sumerlaeota bacterium]|nr:hypothetical protein [Candidatus Sumerlaeota bacterium]